MAERKDLPYSPKKIMDIQTPLGQWSLAKEYVIMRKLCKKMSWFDVPTPRDMPAPLDGVMSDDVGMVFVYEVKCRDTTLVQLQNWGTYLISYSKIVAGAQASALFCVPFVVLVHTTQDDRLISLRITNEKGEVKALMEVSETETQATINGGKAKRLNAYINMDIAKVLI